MSGRSPAVFTHLRRTVTEQMGALLIWRPCIRQVLRGVKVRPSLRHGRCVNGPSLFLNAAGRPHNKHNLRLVSVKGLRVNFHRFVTEELLFLTVQKPYIIKVARPLCLSVARGKNWINSALFACFGHLWSTVMLSLCAVFHADLSQDFRL